VGPILLPQEEIVTFCHLWTILQNLQRQSQFLIWRLRFARRHMRPTWSQDTARVLYLYPIRDPSFTSVLFRETCKILGIKQMNSSAYHPQSHGAIEKYRKTMNQGLSHYVNAAGTNWDTLVPFYLMAYGATPHGTSGYSPYYLLHGREMVLPTSQNLRAKFTPDVRETEYAPRLEKLKSTLRTAYRLVRENSRKAHATNKRYYDRKARERSFEPGDVVYLFSPAKKPGQNSTFWTPWQGLIRWWHNNLS
jgi:hypothetical protein